VHFTKMLFGAHNLGRFTLQLLPKSITSQLFDVFAFSKEHNPAYVPLTEHLLQTNGV